MTLPGPSRTIVVEPVERPEAQPAPATPAPPPPAPTPPREQPAPA